MSSFWSGWIIVLSVVNILACFWLIRWTMKKRAGESTSGDVTGHTWDDDLQEYNNPLPRWWLWLFYITLIFAFLYLALYPGLGSFQGTIGWSSHGSQYEAEMQAAEKKYGPIYQQFAAVSVDDLASKPEYEEARAMGKRLFLTYCMQCHGSDGRGFPNQGYPNLADNDWLWGGSAEQIKTSIANGRIAGMGAGMPAQAHLGEEAIDNLTSYVASLSGRSVDSSKAEAGKQVFMTSGGCAGCHNADGTGNQMLGAPNLTDNIWLYGGSEGAIKQTLTKGRKGVMPAHQELLGGDKVHLLAAYVSSLSK